MHCARYIPRFPFFFPPLSFIRRHGTILFTHQLHRQNVVHIFPFLSIQLCAAFLFTRESKSRVRMSPILLALSINNGWPDTFDRLPCVAGKFRCGTRAIIRENKYTIVKLWYSYMKSIQYRYAPFAALPAYIVLCL